MKQKSVEFFQNDRGESSPIRWISFASLIGAIIFGIMSFTLDSKAVAVEITYGLLAAGFGTKVTKKFSESSREK